MEPMIQVENLCKSFSTKSGTVEAARNISFSIEKGEIFGIIGLSGAGKSTLVRCLNLLERPTEQSGSKEKISWSFRKGSFAKNVRISE